jgi:hypothetical protein
VGIAMLDFVIRAGFFVGSVINNIGNRNFLFDCRSNFLRRDLDIDKITSGQLGASSSLINVHAEADCIFASSSSRTGGEKETYHAPDRFSRSTVPVKLFLFLFY